MKALFVGLNLFVLWGMGIVFASERKLVGYDCGPDLSISFEKGFAALKTSANQTILLPFFGRGDFSNDEYIFGPYHAGMCQIRLQERGNGLASSVYRCRDHFDMYSFTCQAIYKKTVLDVTETNTIVPMHTTGTIQDARDAVTDAIHYYDRYGAMATFGAINSEGMFRPADDIYLIILQAVPDGFIMAHGYHPGYIGFPVRRMKTPDGRMIGLEMIEQGIKNGQDQGAWLTYHWKNYHRSKTLELRQSWFVLHDGLIFLASSYVRDVD